jgi:putative molybdopterin biosynthesis protein
MSAPALPLYQQIAAALHQQIIQGRLAAGARLPSIRKLTAEWNCTPGTVQKAFAELARQGLIISQAGKGTHVTAPPPPGNSQQGALRRAALLHRSESFLLEALAAGYEVSEVQQAFGLALERWRTVEAHSEPARAQTLRFAGSHDPAVVWLSEHFEQVAAGASLTLQFSGSLGGLMALAAGRADVAGCHLWDAESNSYNLPFIRKLFPGRKMQLIHLARRRIGLLLAPGNRLNLLGLSDLSRAGVRFVNRQLGSGTRVWLDAMLLRLKLDPAAIQGYEMECLTHSEVARAVAEGQADVGLGLESAAAAFGLDYIHLTDESYDLAAAADSQTPALAALQNWLADPTARQPLLQLPGYDFSRAGQVILSG